MFRIADWISEADSDDGGTCFLCDGCDRTGDTFDAVKHSESCPIGEIERLEKIVKAREADIELLKAGIGAATSIYNR